MPEPPQIDRLIAEVAARHGILLKKDDAAFALVTLNQLVLESAINNFVSQTRTAMDEFEAAMDRVQERAGVAIAREVAQLASSLASPPNRSTAPNNSTSQKALRLWCLTGGLVAGFAAGIALCRIL